MSNHTFAEIQALKAVPEDSSSSQAPPAAFAEAMTIAVAAPDKRDPMRVILLVVGLAIVLFLALSSFGIYKAGVGNTKLAQIKSLYFPVLERIDVSVDRAGATMTDVVGAIKRVTDIMGEISAASGEQSTGVAQIGVAVHQMDEVTQQNAALVEQSAAAAESLKVQARQLVQTVAVFKLA